jgi:hypothetical protein
MYISWCSELGYSPVAFYFVLVCIGFLGRLQIPVFIQECSYFPTCPERTEEYIFILPSRRESIFSSVSSSFRALRIFFVPMFSSSWMASIISSAEASPAFSTSSMSSRALSFLITGSSTPFSNTRAHRACFHILKERDAEWCHLTPSARLFLLDIEIERIQAFIRA